MKSIRTGIRSMFLILAILAVIAIPVSAQDVIPLTSMYVIESRCEYNEALVFDPSANANSHICNAQTTKDGCQKYNFCWWRDTTAQNALADHSDEYPGTVSTVYSAPDLTVLTYSSAGGPNVTAIIGTTELLIIGAGGNRAYAVNAKLAFQNSYSGFTGKHLLGIVLPSVDTEDSWGITYWRLIFHANPPAPLIVNASYASALQKRGEVNAELVVRKSWATGINLTCGEDGFLGEGSMKEYRPNFPSFIPPSYSDIYVSEPVDIHLNGIPIRLIPTFEEDAGLLVFLLHQEIMLAGNLGKFLPDAAPIAEPNVPIEKWMQTLGGIRSGAYTCHCSYGYSYPDCHEGGGHCPAPQYLITGRGPYLSDAVAINEALTVQYDALKYLHDETVKDINLHMSLDDIVSIVRLPAPLACSPYAREFTSTIPGIVRSVYHDHLGWFEGNPASLESLSTLEQAMREIAFGGGEKQVLSYVRQCITEHSRAGALEALKKTSVLRLIYPSAEANAVYVQALKMLAFTTPSAHFRNYYLSEIQKIENY